MNAVAVIEAASRRLQRRVSPATARYYGTHPTAEEVIMTEGAGSLPGAFVTRNHYGCLVLNARRTMFIDIDFEPADETLISGQSQCRDELREQKNQRELRTLLSDLRTVLLGQRSAGFRMYGTAAGIRLLATTKQYDPVAPVTLQLMQSVGADRAFVKLCKIQSSFRARLSPKPWRCGAEMPPNSFPRESAIEKRNFAAWRESYDDSCSGRATCRFLEQIGSPAIHPAIEPIVHYHDRETRAHEPLPLA